MTNIKNRTPIGDLSGDLTTTPQTPQATSGSSAPGSGLSVGDTFDHLLATIILTPTKAKNLVILRWSVEATNNSDITIDEGATELGRINGTVTGLRTLNIVLEDVSISTHTYNFWTRFDGSFYQYGVSPGLEWFGQVIDIDDTHASTAKKLDKIIGGS